MANTESSMSLWLPHPDVAILQLWNKKNISTTGYVQLYKTLNKTHTEVLWRQQTAPNFSSTLLEFGASLCYLQSRDSSVGIALGYGLDDRGSRVRLPAGAGNFSLRHRVQNGSESHPASYPTGTRALSLGVKRPVREADHSPPLSAEVKNAWIYTSTPQYVFMAWCLVKHRDNFIFTFYLYPVT
jgi:hypothetical protein